VQRNVFEAPIKIIAYQPSLAVESLRDNHPGGRGDGRFPALPWAAWTYQRSVVPLARSRLILMAASPRV